MNTDNYSKYERMYDILLDYEQKIHLKNQKRIRIGLKCLIIIPLIFLAMLFWTGSSKTIFLVLWIVSLFILAAYLVFVEYSNYKLQEKLNELDERGDAGVEALIGPGVPAIDGPLKSAVKKLDATLNSETLAIEEEGADKNEEHN